MNNTNTICSNLCEMLDAAILSLKSQNTMEFNKIKDYFSNLDTQSLEYIKEHGGHKIFDNFKNCLNKPNIEKLNLHAQKLKKVIALTANDNPFKVKDKVYIIRHEHGWSDGNMSGEVIVAQQNGKKWSYIIRVEENYGNKLSKKEQFNVQVNHTRDLSRF